MRRFVCLLLTAVICLVTFAGCGTKDKSDGKSQQTNSSGTSKLKDGDYEIQTKPDVEGYFSKAKVTIKDGKITNVDWKIIDSQNRVFDEKYEDVFPQAEYKEQCRNDLKGAKSYVSQFIETQDLSKVDAIAAATWANTKFKEAMEMILGKAKN
ncbi:MAG: hypothetical protein Q8930_09005 [Bacillota bacterium]|nr:hypothetical protein [Bacillota bacterium]